MRNKIDWAFATLLAICFTSCKKDAPIPVNEPPKPVNYSLDISYRVGTTPLIFDSLCYTNAAGNQYEVQRMEYYISNITLYAADGSQFKATGIHYINARKAGMNSILLNDVPVTDYVKMTLNIGIDSAHNISYALPATTENMNMAWPDAMGGGYHFMKWEGNYLINAGKRGYTLHLGGNSSLVYCEINSPFTVSTSHTALTLAMDLNEWFQSPQNYDLNTDGYSIMGNRVAQLKIAKNGINVFSIL